MKWQFYSKILLNVLTDCLAHWFSWVVSVLVATALFMVDPSVQQMSLHDVVRQLPIIMVATLVFFFACGVYKSLWRHPGVGSMIRTSTAVFLSTFVVYLSFRVTLGRWLNPGHGVMVFYFLLTLSFLPRLWRPVLDVVISYWQKKTEPAEASHIRTLIIGAGDSASGLLLNRSQQGRRPRKILGVLDNDTSKHGYTMHGVPILGGDEKIPQLVNQLGIQEIVVAVPSMTNEELRRIVRLTPPNRCKVRILVGLSSDKSAEKLREISISDLLGRQESMVDTQAIGDWISGKTVLVTGGGGSIGSEICRQLLSMNAGKVVVFDISENNAYNLKEELKVNFGQDGRYKVAVRIGSVQDDARLAQVFEEFAPEVVFHAAAYKHVPLMEECPRLAIDNNVIGTYRTALAAINQGVERFVMISTDKAVNPTNVMGASKRIAELVTLGLNGVGRTEFVCVRFGNVLDSNGSVIPLFRRQIQAGGPVTVTHPNIIRYFMTICEASRLVLEAGAMANGGEIFILDMGGQVKIVDLAENLIRMAGYTPDVDIKIEYTGLRPGEKLYEELLLNEEGLGNTQNNKIFVVKPPPCPRLAQLLECLDANVPQETMEVIRLFVPEYVASAGDTNAN